VIGCSFRLVFEPVVDPTDRHLASPQDLLQASIANAVVKGNVKFLSVARGLP
jgi:hypothetical protein